MSGAQANGHMRGRKDVLTRTEVATTGRLSCSVVKRDAKSLKSFTVSGACDALCISRRDRRNLKLMTAIYNKSTVDIIINV